MAAGVSWARVASLLFSTTLIQSLSSRSICSMSLMGISCLSFMVRAWEWERMAPMRTQIPSMGTRGLFCRILLVSAWPFHSSRVCPSSTSRSIQGMREPARGTPNSSVGRALPWRAALTVRSISRIAEAGSASSVAALCWRAPIWFRSSRMLRAPAPEAAW